jgi:nitrogen-specific signal transduction histidine kinase
MYFVKVTGGDCVNGLRRRVAVKANIYNPFFTTKQLEEGVGLGLSPSYHIIIKQPGGAIEIETGPGAFTQFTIRSPGGAPPGGDPHETSCRMAA